MVVAVLSVTQADAGLATPWVDWLADVSFSRSLIRSHSDSEIDCTPHIALSQRRLGRNTLE
jgi:hypothetical protein